jgi:hypothetical protein
MTDKLPTGKATEFGKRRPMLPAQPAPKRSGHVALLVMGTLAVGGGAYALISGESCAPPAPAAPGMAAPAMPQTTACTSRGGSGGYGGYGGSSRYSFYGDSSNRGSAAGSTDASSGGVTRGGFGAFARAFGFSGG